MAIPERMNSEEAAEFWERRQSYWQGEIGRTAIPTVDGRRVIVNESGFVLYDDNNQPVSPVDERWNGTAALQRRRVEDVFGDDFFDDDVK